MKDFWDDDTPAIGLTASTMPKPPARRPSPTATTGAIQGATVIPTADKPRTVLQQLSDTASALEKAEAEEDALLAKHGLSASPVRSGLPYQSLTTAGSGAAQASPRPVSLPDLSFKDKVPAKKPFLPARPTKQPSVSASKPAARPVRPDLGETLRSGSKLTYTAPSKNANGEIVENEYSIVITESDMRWFMGLSEFGMMTRKQMLVLLEPLNKETMTRRLDSIRKRLKMLVDAGIIQTEGGDQGYLTLYSLTAYGREMCPDSFTGKNADFKAEDEGTVLNRATLAIQFITPQAKPIITKATVPLPVVSRNRIMADSQEMKAGKAMRYQQDLDTREWLSMVGDARGIRNRYNYPVVPETWTYDQMDQSMAVRIESFFRKGTRATDGHILKPSYMFNTFDENGRPENLIDFVVALPHMKVQTATGPVLMPLSMANVLALVNQSDAYWQTTLGKIANSVHGFAKLIVWVPDNASIAASVERNWATLRANHFIPTGREDMLHIQSYDPINANTENYSMYTPDTAGKAAKHYFKG